MTAPATELARLGWSVLLAVLPLLTLFLIFQAMFLKLPRRELSRVLTGTLLAAIGLFLFLLGVNVALLPIGRALGEAIGTAASPPRLLGFGLVLGFVTTWGEPAVRILADQVDDASSGSIRRVLVLWAVCLGVAIAVGLGLLRVVLGVPLLALLLPGYSAAIALVWMSEPRFVSIAIDSGGVATGPLANTFLLALALGVASAAEAGDPLVQGLGLVALIALAPVISVLVLGLIVRRKERLKES